MFKTTTIIVIALETGINQKKIRLLKIDWGPVELSGKTAMISTKPRPPQNYYLFWIDHLVGKSSFKRGEIFRTN